MTPDTAKVVEFGADTARAAGPERMRELNVLKCLLGGGRLAEARQYVQPEDFAGKDTRQLAERIWSAPEGSDRHALFMDFALTDAGNRLLVEIPTAFGVAQSTSAYARALARERLRQRLVAMCGGALNDLRRGDPEEVASRLGLNLSLAEPSITLAQALDEAISEGQRSAEKVSEGKAAGLSTGLAALDRRTGGVLRGDLWTLVADTSMGKSALLLQIGRKIALQGTKIGYISLEMPARDIGRRLMASAAGVNGTELRKGDANALRAARAIAPSLGTLPVLIDTDSDTPDAIESRLYRWHAEGVEVVMLDHLMCVNFDRRDPFGDQGRLMQRLRRMTMTLDMAVLVATQYRKDSGESRKQADIYGAAAVSQYSTHVLAIHPDKAHDDCRRLELYKNRDGVKGALAAQFDFNGRTQTFTERLAPVEPPSDYPPLEDFPV